MEKNILHITNGGNLTKYLNELEIAGEKLTWQEIICEGPTKPVIHSESFIALRRTFLNDFYDVDLDLDKVNFALEQLSNPERYTEIVLWFEYDLFCHLNMIAVINLLVQKKINLPMSLVCSGRIKGSKTLKGLTELTSGQILSHYKNKVSLTPKDIDLAVTLWGIYCGKDHNLLKPYIVQGSSFEYLSNCLKAHLERFPDSKSGLNILEMNILKLIKEENIKSRHHLLGYALNYQGYYGFGDMQINRIIDKLSRFFNEDDDKITLNRIGYEALLKQHNFSKELNSDMNYGGVSIAEFHFSKEQNKLVKVITHAN